MICKNCKALLPDGTEVCPYCNKNPNIKEKQKGPNFPVRVLLLCAVILLAASISYYLFQSARLKSAQIPSTTAYSATIVSQSTAASTISTSTTIATNEITTSTTTTVPTTAATTASAMQTTHRILNESSAVYVTESGSKYHSANCSAIADSQAKAVSARAAVSSGYAECSLCLPGVYTGPTDTTAAETIPQTQSQTEPPTTAPSSTASRTTKAAKTEPSATKQTTTKQTTTDEPCIWVVFDDRYYHLPGCPTLPKGSELNLKKSEYGGPKKAKKDDGKIYLDPCPVCMK